MPSNKGKCCRKSTPTTGMGNRGDLEWPLKLPTQSQLESKKPFAERETIRGVKLMLSWDVLASLVGGKTTGMSVPVSTRNRRTVCQSRKVRNEKHTGLRHSWFWVTAPLISRNVTTGRRPFSWRVAKLVTAERNSLRWNPILFF